jgi:hypothetical protein
LIFNEAVALLVTILKVTTPSGLGWEDDAERVNGDVERGASTERGACATGWFDVLPAI